MSDFEKSNDRIDHFSERIRQRLADNPTPPDASCWDEIEARLPKRRTISPVWIGLAIAASVIVAVFILNNAITKNGRSTYNKALVSERNISDEKTTGENIIVEEHDLETALGHTSSPTTRKIPISPSTEAEMPESSSIEKNIEQEDSTERQKNVAEQEEQDEKDREESTPIPGDFDKFQYRSAENLMAYDTDRKYRPEKGKKWLLLTGLGSAGGGLGYLLSSLASLDKEAGPMSPSPPDFEANDPEGNGNLSEDCNKNITEVNPSFPVSLGITVRKRLNKTIGIETGLLYTYLSSDLRISGAEYNDATLKLHYIGIPVNLTVNLWDKNRWNIYASGGGMVEKGLRSVYVKRGYNVYSKEKNNISGLQWSLNGGIGLSYGLYKNMNLYVVPGFSYYFDCNQPISKRTEDPFSFNLRAGIRYDF